MIHKALSLIVLLVVVTIGLTIYLQPNDLDKCALAPGSDAKCAMADAIVAVSGGDTGARTKQAVDLYKKGWSKTLIFSGAAQDKSGPSNAAAMKALAVADGVDAGDIYLDEYSATTQQNAENSQTIFESRSIKNVILVTSGYHQRRASLEFNKRTHGVIIRNSPVLTDSDWSYWWWTNPHGWWLALSESAKIVVFYVTGIWS